jgi:cytosine/adenosine deaminase-related metal-dependent hydrolase
MAADITLFDLSAPRNFGLHDPAVAPMVTGAAQVRQSFVAGRPVVCNGAIAGLDLTELGHEAARITHRIGHLRPAAMPA